MANSETLTAGETPVLVTINRRLYWQAGGRTFPLIAGAEDPPGDNSTSTSNQDGDPPHDGGDQGDDFDKDRALSTIRKLRDAEKNYKAQLKELESLKAEQRKREDAEKSETEKLRQQIADAERQRVAIETELQETRNRTAIERAAAKAGATDPEDIFRLIEVSDFEHDDDGKLTNAEKLVADLLKKKPYLAGKPATTSTGVPGTPRSTGQPGREDRVKAAEEKLIATRQYQPFG